MFVLNLDNPGLFGALTPAHSAGGADAKLFISRDHRQPIQMIKYVELYGPLWRSRKELVKYGAPLHLYTSHNVSGGSPPLGPSEHCRRST